MYDGNPWSSQREVRVSEGSSYRKSTVRSQSVSIEGIKAKTFLTNARQPEVEFLTFLGSGFALEIWKRTSLKHVRLSSLMYFGSFKSDRQPDWGERRSYPQLFLKRSSTQKNLSPTRFSTPTRNSRFIVSLFEFGN